MGEPWLLINLVVTSFSWMVTKTVLGDEPLVCSLKEAPFKEAPLKVTPEPMADECPTCKENIILVLSIVTIRYPRKTRTKLCKAASK